MSKLSTILPGFLSQFGANPRAQLAIYHRRPSPSLNGFNASTAPRLQTVQTIQFANNVFFLAFRASKFCKI